MGDMDYLDVVNNLEHPIAKRKYKVDLDVMKLKNKKGFVKAKKTIQDRKITSQEIAMYRWNMRKYVYAIRPFKIVMNKVIPPAHAADNINKICATGANCTDEDYNSVGAWESAVDGDLVTATTREIGELFDDDGNFNEDWTIDGSTTNSSYYMFLRAGTGEEHNGDFSTGVATTQSGHLAMQEMRLTLHEVTRL